MQAVCPPRRRRADAFACTLALAVVTVVLPAGAQPSPPPAQQVEVIGTSALAGLGVDRDLLPYASQTARRVGIDQAQTEQVTDFLSRRMVGMQVNDIQGSPLQADLTFRGYRASGLLGTSQGLSVYLDGVRINEPFGDVVQWDMVPEFALQSITVVPGANPAFGLNTLGGAVTLATDNGLSAPGLNAELGLGSHGRRRAQASLGQQHGDGWHSYVGGTVFGDDGWRDASPGRQALIMARVGRRQGGIDWDLSWLGGRSTLVGNGLLPAVTLDGGQAEPDLYSNRRQAVYTHPDRSQNHLSQLSGRWSLQVDEQSRLQALAYHRSSRRDTLNGDVADEAVGALNAALNTSHTRQGSWGLALSLARRSGAHQWQLGATLDRSRVRFRQLEQEGSFNTSRGVVAGAEAQELSAELRGSSRHLGLYATDTWRLASATHLSATLRLNQARVRNQLSTVDDNSNALDIQPAESFHYRSLNPALGLTHRLRDGLSLFGNLARNTRVPTAIELGCADPDKPCRLPVGLQSDPYLAQVRSTSAELGARWLPATGHRVEFSAYRTDNRDDILFGSVSATSQLGYFRNFERTRHQGLDASYSGRSGPLQFSLAYSHLLATYQADGTLRMGERNVSVTPGTRIAGLPRHSAKLAADWGVAAGFSLGADWQLLGSRGVQANEDGRLEDDDAAGSHPLKIAGYGLLNLRASWQFRPGLSLLARVNNALDRRHETYGALASTVFDAQGAYSGTAREALFVAPGAPRSLFVGLRLTP